MMSAQLVHAAGESSFGNLPKNTHAVVLAVPGEENLLELEKQLLEAKIPHNAIREVDSPYNGQLMAIGICPTTRDKVKGLLSQLPLVK